MGLWNVHALLDEMPWVQFYAWLRYSQVEPFGEPRADLRMGQICATVVNANPYRKAGARLLNATDFVFRFGDSALGVGRRESGAVGGRGPIRDAATWREVKGAFVAEARAHEMAAEAERARQAAARAKGDERRRAHFEREARRNAARGVRKG